MAACALVQEVIYIRSLLNNLGFNQDDPTPIFEDNNTCIAWSEGAVGGSDRAKHIDLRQHFVHEAVEQKILKLGRINSSDNAADIMTKPLSAPNIITLRRKILGM